MMYNLEKADIVPSYRSDHSMISLSFTSTPESPRGRGFWKFNNSLLTDSVYAGLINERLNILQKQYHEEDDKGLKWEIIKCEIRNATINYSKLHLEEMN